MMETEDRFKKLFDASLAAYTARELRWWKQDRRGRWVVLEPGPGRLLRNAPRHIRDYADSITAQRGRRFSSLSRARKFAHQVGGKVRHWQRNLPGRARWRLVTNPWEGAVQSLPMPWLPWEDLRDPSTTEGRAAEVSVTAPASVSSGRAR